MGNINWDEAPEFGVRRSIENNRWLREACFVIEEYHESDGWFTFANQDFARRIWGEAVQRPEHKPLPPKKSGSKYIITMKNKLGESIDVDAYDIITACNITCPAHAHAAKKVLYTGLRGHKDKATDLRESIDALERAIELATKS